MRNRDEWMSQSVSSIWNISRWIVLWNVDSVSTYLTSMIGHNIQWRVVCENLCSFGNRFSEDSDLWPPQPSCVTVYILYWGIITGHQDYPLSSLGPWHDDLMRGEAYCICCWRSIAEVLLPRQSCTCHRKVLNKTQFVLPISMLICKVNHNL